MRFVQTGVLLFLGLIYGLLTWSTLSDSDTADHFRGWLFEVFPGDIYDGPTLAFIIGWNVLLAAVAILVAVDAVRKVRAGKTQQLATGVFVVKLAAIPYFVLNFVILFAFAAIDLRYGGVVSLLTITIGIPLTWLLMLSTSIYGWATIVRLRRERRLGIVRAVLYGILLAIFGADIVVGIVLFVHSLRRRLPSPDQPVPHESVPDTVVVDA